jgi:hypothetical protein
VPRLEDGQDGTKDVHVAWLGHNGLEERDDCPPELKERDEPPRVDSSQNEVAWPQRDNLEVSR